MKNDNTRTLLSRLFGGQILIPLAALLLLTVFNLIADPGFFEIKLGYNSAGQPVLSGNLITIIDCGSELAILAAGMTLVTAASKGQDISVGALTAISGSVLLKVFCSQSHPSIGLILVSFLVSCLVAMIFGAFNGSLVAFFRIQPMVATLILFTAGRSIAAWINNNELPVVTDECFGWFGNYFPGVPVPTPIFITAAFFIITWILLRSTNTALYVQSTGINEETSRLNGLRPELIKLMTYMFMGVCTAIAGFIKVSRLSTINYSVIAKDIEMDAILAVALGGNSLSGGRFNIRSSVLGAYVIQFLTTTLYKFEVRSDALSAYKAAAVIILVVFSSPAVREKLSALLHKRRRSADAGTKA